MEKKQPIKLVLNKVTTRTEGSSISVGNIPLNDDGFTITIKF